MANNEKMLKKIEDVLADTLHIQNLTCEERVKKCAEHLIQNKIIPIDEMPVADIPVAIGDTVYFVNRRNILSKWIVYRVVSDVALRPKSDNDTTLVLCKNWSIYCKNDSDDSIIESFSDYDYGYSLFTSEQDAIKHRHLVV